MKKIITIYITLFCINTIIAQPVSFCDDFEGYQNGDYIAQSSTDWETWASVMGPCSATPCADDAQISSVQSTSGNQSLYLNDAVGTGGPADIILPFGSGIPHTTGNFELTTDLYITSSAYLNIQAEPYVTNTSLGTTGIWSLNITMDNLGVITIDGGTNAIVYITSTYSLNQWFELKIDIDLTQNIWEIYIDNQLIGSFSNTSNKISSLNLYPTEGNDYYVDDICYTYTPYVALTYDMSAIGLDLSSNVSLSSSPFIISGDILNLSSTIINSLDLNYSIDGSTPIIDNLTGLNLSLFDTLNFNHSINWTPPLIGPYLVEIWATNINGNNDLNTSNDILGKSIYVWNDIAVRRPLIETFTSSTCGPCNPANITAETLFSQNTGKFTSIKYQADFPGTGDPYYTNEVGERMDYYMPSGTASVPRMEIDGGWDQNGNNITQQVLDDHIQSVSFINLSATYSINIKNIEVDIIIDPLEDILSNNLLIHAAIIEETTYNNIKTNGETQFEHVVKKMLPNASGTQLSPLAGGAQHTEYLQYEFQGNYRLPSNANDPIDHTAEHSVENFSNLMVAVWVQDNITKEIHQSTMATLTSLITESFNCDDNSCIDPLDGTGTYSSISNCEATCNTTAIEEDRGETQLVSPNPARDNIYISNLKSKARITVYDINGRIVLERGVSNKQDLNISNLAKGAYQIKLEGPDWTETRRLVVE